MRVLIVLALGLIACLAIDDFDTSSLTPVPMHSFRPPYSTGRLGIKYWSYGGSVVVHQDYLRLTQDLNSQSGFIWNRHPVSIRDWEVTMSVRIDGKGRLGGDGIAFWYVKDPNVEGKAFGAREVWEGLGIFIDTFDNDNKRDNPYVSVIVNDGTKTYRPDNDGKDLEVGGCRAGFRKTAAAAFLRIRYRGSTKTLEVYHDINSNGRWQECYSGSVDLPTGYYFGISAATGGVSDNHDINYFELRRLDMENGQPTPSQGASFGTKDPEEQAQDEKAAKELDDLKKELDELKKVTTETKPADPAAKPADVPAGDLAGRIAILEEQLKQMESKLAAIAKVSDKINTVSTSVETLKQRIERNKPSGGCDTTQLKSELNRQQQELNRIAARSQEEIKSSVLERVMSLEQTTSGLTSRVNELTTQSKKTGGGGFLSVIMVVIMAGESILLLVMFMKNRRVEKYDKMW